MKKKLIIATVALVLSSVSFFGMKQSTPTTVSKNINVEIYKSASYVSNAYADAYATLHVTVLKVNGNKRDTAWQHDFAPTQLKNFPASDKPLVQQISISNVNDKKEKLEIFYTLTYSTKGSELNFSDGTVIGKGTQTGKLNIKI